MIKSCFDLRPQYLRAYKEKHFNHSMLSMRAMTTLLRNDDNERTESCLHRYLLSTEDQQESATLRHNYELIIHILNSQEELLVRPRDFTLKQRSKMVFEHGRIRTCNLLIRSQTRYPLRHAPRCPSTTKPYFLNGLFEWPSNQN